jgi:hypothetical protein
MSPDVTNSQEVKATDKEMNFRAQQQKYERLLEQERNARLEAERVAQEATNKRNQQEEEEDDSEPYVDKKKLNRTLAKFGEQTKQNFNSEIQKAVQIAREQEKQENWLESNPDFYNILQTHSEKLVQKSPMLAKSILNMPDNFERQKLVYLNIKELGLDKPEVKQTSIQDKVNANQRSPYYQPSGVGSSPYSQASDFSVAGQKSAYDKMKALQNRVSF